MYQCRGPSREFVEVNTELAGAGESIDPEAVLGAYQASLSQRATLGTGPLT